MNKTEALADISYLNDPLSGKTGRVAIQEKIGGVVTEIINGLEYSELSTASKTVVGAINEIQKNCIYQVNATRVIEGVLEIYDTTIDGSDEFTPFNQTFLIDFSETNTQVDSLLRFNGNTYSLRFSDSITNGDISPKIGFIPKRALVKLDVTNSKAIIVSSLDFSEETTNFTSATGSVLIPSGLPVGTKKLIRKINSTAGDVNITCTGETFSSAGLTTLTLNVNGSYFELEKVSSTIWEIVSWGGRKLVDCTSSRVISGTYTNTSGKEIEIQVPINGSATAMWYFILDGVKYAALLASGGYGFMTFNVPNGSTYKIPPPSSGTSVILAWYEWR